MSVSLPSTHLQPDVHELILGSDPGFACDTFIFEPTTTEAHLGHLVAVAETRAQGDEGKQLLDLTVTSIQKEYYRDPPRGMLASFEAALHQGNLVLNEVAQEGMRDWMQHFHVAMGVLQNQSLHISIAGEATIFIVRGGRATTISEGLNHAIVNPLRCFSHVASGTVQAGDMVFLGTAPLPTLASQHDLVQMSHERSALAATAAFKKMYQTQRSTMPLALLVISLLSQSVSRADTYPLLSSRRSVHTTPRAPFPRQPLLLQLSVVARVWLILSYLIKLLIGFVKRSVWPLLKRGSQVGSQMVWSTSHATGREMYRLATQGWQRQEVRVTERIKNLPWSSKILGVITVVLIVVLVISVVLLRAKRVEESQIQRASEILHEANTKQQAATNSLIYNDREQALKLLAESESLLKELEGTGLYVEEVKKLRVQVATARDRAAGITRISSNQLTTIGDFSSALAGKNVSHLFLLKEAFFTFEPSQNQILRLSAEGEVQKATSSTQGIGFFEQGIRHEADQQIILLTSEPGIAVFDVEKGSLTDLTIDFPAADSVIKAMSMYGNRLYLYDATTRNVHVYNKTLLGYSGQTPWLLAPETVEGEVNHMAIDGALYVLQANGQIKKFFKGEIDQSFTSPVIVPALQNPKRILTSADLQHLYVLDGNQRVVVISKKGQLVAQFQFEEQPVIADLMVDAGETTLYVLADNKVVATSLAPQN